MEIKTIGKKELIVKIIILLKGMSIGQLVELIEQLTEEER